ncbi:MAG TPA: hypothetical protein VGH28_31070 [Polyangiaceae bacterium]|jgi:hypothetical protein
MLTESQIARALVVLAEALVSERRVIVVGDSSLGLQGLLVDLGARLVHVYDPDGERAASQDAPAARGTTLRALPEGDFEVRDGAFDLAIVPDVAAIEDVAALLARLRRVVGASGAVLCAAPNREEGDALDYYALYDVVALQFSHVRMIAAMPFAGVTLAELGQDEVDAAVRVDTQLAGDRPPPSAYVALASQSDAALDAYAVIELEPNEEVPAKSVDHAALAQARLRADVLQSQLAELADTRAAQARAEEEARRALEALDIERARAQRLERDLDALSAARAKAPEPQPQKAADDLAEQLAETQIRAAALEEGVELAEKTIVAQRDRIAELEGRLAEAEEAAALAPPEPTHADTDVEHENAALEAKLRECGEKILALEGENARREKLVRELVARLEPAELSGEANGELAQKLDDLAVLAARQESELEARAWRIAELERATSEHAEPPA